MNKNIGKILVYIGIPIVLLMIALRFVLYYFKSDGFNWNVFDVSVTNYGCFYICLVYVRFLCSMGISGLQEKK